jgi:hypothetical protein
MNVANFTVDKYTSKNQKIMSQEILYYKVNLKIIFTMVMPVAVGSNSLLKAPMLVVELMINFSSPSMLARHCTC